MRLRDLPPESEVPFYHIDRYDRYGFNNVARKLKGNQVWFSRLLNNIWIIKNIINFIKIKLVKYHKAKNSRKNIINQNNFVENDAFRPIGLLQDLDDRKLQFFN
ncbi:hypothetical protein BpHYR1_029577 [Brachionus plicatilis]|uniref:Uncharacterized protein n=1 Tax=Brachionus plicatilis TaxID=10195 RepID=A0A3M7S508_BRAPC|nr:hypothetical protein BpHYR1_029577 [Brachionus plicatilis]